MMSLVSGATNGCVYCTSHHGALMRTETGDALFAEYLSRNYSFAPLSPRSISSSKCKWTLNISPRPTAKAYAMSVLTTRPSGA